MMRQNFQHNSKRTPGDPILSLKPFLDPTKKVPQRLCENVKFWANFDLKMAAKHPKIGIFEKFKQEARATARLGYQHKF